MILFFVCIHLLHRLCSTAPAPSDFLAASSLSAIPAMPQNIWAKVSEVMVIVMVVMVVVVVVMVVDLVVVVMV